MFLYLSNLDLGLSPVPNFSNTAARAPTSADHVSCLREGRRSLDIHLVLKSWKFFVGYFSSSVDATLIDEKQ